MTQTKQMICLANSRKLSGRCVAGRELVDGVLAGWIRPVSDRLHQEVSEYERQYQDGSDPAVLDVIDVPLLRSAPNSFQRENWILDPEYYWTKVGEVSVDDLSSMVDGDTPLWIDGYSTYNGANDKIPLDLAEQLTSSLALVRAPSVELRVFAPGEAFGNSKRRVQARFSLSGTHYALWVTDPVYERRYLAEDNGTYGLGECYLTLSIGEPYNGETFKLVATIVER